MTNTTLERHRNKAANGEGGIPVTNLRDSKTVRLVVVGILIMIVAYLLYSVS